MIQIALTIAGSDSGGGAGIQADLRTFHRFGVYGTSAITLITAQNTRELRRVEYLSPELILQQIQAVAEDLPPSAVKTGALGSAQAVEAIASVPFHGPLVIDPVSAATRGGALADSDTFEAMRRLLLPKAALVTPNLAEASMLTGFPVESISDMRRAAERIAAAGVAAVLVKGGHLESSEATDILFARGEMREFTSPRLHTCHTHGTGCTLSAAITAGLALGWELELAVSTAKNYVTSAIGTAPGLGGGAGPLNHWAIIGNSPYDQGSEDLPPAV